MQNTLVDLVAKIKSQAGNTVSSSLPKVILLNGNEPLLVEEALDQLRAQFKTVGFAERLTYRLETGFDWSLILSAGQTMSMFSEKRLVELRVPGKLGSAGIKAINEYCANPPEDDVLLLIMPLLDKQQRNAAWFKKLSSVATIVDFYDVALPQFPQWIKQRLQSRALRVENGVVELMTQQLEGNLLAAAQEIDKLQVLASDGAVTLELLSECMADQTKFDVYQLTDTALAGNFNKASRILGRLKTEGVEPVIIVWALVRDIRTLALIASEIEQGGNRAQLFKAHRIWNKRQPIVNAALDRLPTSTWYELINYAAKLDQTVKGQRYDGVGSIWFQLEQVCAVLCGINTVNSLDNLLISA